MEEGRRKPYYYLFLVIVFVPLASIQHFVEPLSYCLLADICNHTWIPECGSQGIDNDDFRIFTDECDMYEFNCDKNKKYVVVNYSECFRPFTGCPTKRFFRVGDYKYILEGRQILYAPTHRPYPRMGPTPTTRVTFPTRPHGIRRYTPELRRQAAERRRLAAENVLTTEKVWTTKKVWTTMRVWTTSKARATILSRTVILKKIIVEKNGTKFYKVIKGYPTTTMKYDSDFLE